MNQPQEQEDTLDTLVRDLTTVHPMPKSEVRRRLSDFIECAKAEERERGKQVVFLILPLAKGYAHQHDVGSNNRYIEIAENYLATPQEI